MRYSRFILIFIFFMVFFVGCNQQNFFSGSVYTEQSTSVEGNNILSSNDPAKVEITVAAAADLQFAFSEIANLFEEQTGIKVTLVFGSTGQLTQQIENGAPYDLLAAANIDYIDQLVSKKLVEEDSVELYAQGRIVVAVNRQAGVSLTDLKDLQNPKIKHIAIANPEHAPYGVAAQQALESFNLWTSLEPNLVLAENVRQALQFIQTGDAEAGIIALSVANVPEIEWVLIDDSLHQPLNQALGILTNSLHQGPAEQFASFINGKYGRPIMRNYGFILPGETPLTSITSTP